MKLVMLVGLLAASLRAQAPDTILVNGKVLTVDARNTVQQAVALCEGKVQRLGRVWADGQVLDTSVEIL